MHVHGFWQRTSLACALLAALVPLGARMVAGAPGGTVHVRWRPALEPAVRQQLEARFRLLDGERLDGDTWRYDLIDPSTGNISALISDAAVEDTYDIDRPNATLDPSAVRTARRERFRRGSDLVASADWLAIALAALAGLLTAFGVGRALIPRRSRGTPRHASSRDIAPVATLDDSSHEDSARLWTATTMLASAPFVIVLCLTLWRTPFPITESVARFEDIVEQPISRFFDPDKAYYRPLSYVTEWAIWHTGESLDTRLAYVKLLSIVPIALMVGLLIWHLRPRTGLEAAAAAVAVGVLIGTPGFRDNLEIGLYDTVINMSLALIVWILLNREWRGWHMPVIVVCTVAAVGFKEPGLVLVPLVIAASWTRAPGVSRSLVFTVTGLAVAYVAFRLSGSAAWKPFEQNIGLGFTEIDQREAAARFGSFPYWMYAYNAMSTMANVLFGEPTRGVFGIVQAVWESRAQPWQIAQVASSVALTSLIAWWGICSFRQTSKGQWSQESRTFAAMMLVLVGAGALSFNYSRDRLAGIAVVFYAIAAFFALRATALRMLQMPRVQFVVAGAGLVLLATTWQMRALGTLEYARLHSWGNQREWFVRLPQRRIQFAHRDVYVRIMESMVEQGRDPAAPRPTRFPPGVALVIGQGR